MLVQHASLGIGRVAAVEPTAVHVFLSRPIGDAVVGYAEWSGGPERTLAAHAMAFGRMTGELSCGTPVLLPTGSRSFTNDVAAGFSWTVATAATLNFEYHLHEAGFGRRDWRRWFDVGSAPGAPPGAAGELWYVRGYASDQQEPVSTHQLFLRAAWPRALGIPLELGGFAFVSLLDGSALTQPSATYHVSDGWTVALYGSGERRRAADRARQLPAAPRRDRGAHLVPVSSSASPTPEKAIGPPDVLGSRM
jgi:hypothetical protein